MLTIRMIMRINKPKRKSEHKNYRADQLKRNCVITADMSAVKKER